MTTLRTIVGGVIFALLVALVVAGCVGLSSSPSSLKPVEDALVFQPARFPEGNWQPEDLPHEDARFEAADGTRLHGWYCPVDRPRAVILFCHGNAGNLTYHYWNARLLREKLGATVLLFDYRGYGKSEGTPSEEGILKDARAARRWLARRAGIAEKDVVLLGYSLGGAVAVDLAASDGARALILESTFTSLPEVAANHAPASVGSLMTNRLDSLAKIGQYHGPLLQMHGDADTVVPFALGQKLFAAANEPKQFIRIPGGRHIGPPSQEYVRALDQFLDKLSAPQQR
jgi:fermentation-respiration switch protein FrsA (DUF1100 family)